MRRAWLVIACGVLMTLGGCGGTPEEVEYKETNLSQFDEMKNDMMKNYKGRGTVNKSGARSR